MFFPSDISSFVHYCCDLFPLTNSASVGLKYLFLFQNVHLCDLEGVDAQSVPRLVINAGTLKRDDGMPDSEQMCSLMVLLLCTLFIVLIFIF